jgi:hypothetical protein
VPQELEYLWRWFVRLDATRASAFSGKSAITENEMGWFFRNRAIQPQPWEVEILASLDLLALQTQSKRRPPRAGS